MIFRVAWARAAANDLEVLFQLTDNPDEIVRAALAVNQRLQIEGNLAGESRAGTLRVVIESPLTCYFRYRASDRTVIVVAVCLRRRQK